MQIPLLKISDGNWVNESSHFLLGHGRSIYEQLNIALVPSLKKTSVTISQQIRVRMFVVTAIASAALEIFAHLILATSFAVVSIFKTTVCLVLQGVFVGMWALIGWLSGQALIKSPLQWVSFVLLQGTLGFANPSHWWSQWKLWGRILHSMGSFANGAAALADWLSDNVNKFASWEHIIMHCQHASHLTLFVLASVRASFVNPKKAIDNYGMMVRAWPLDAEGLLKQAKEFAERPYHPAWKIVFFVTFLSFAHLFLPGYEGRKTAVDNFAHYTWTTSGVLIRTVFKISSTVIDETVGRIWHWYYSGPDEITRNEAARSLTEIKDLLEFYAKQMGHQSQAIKDLQSIVIGEQCPNTFEQNNNANMTSSLLPQLGLPETKEG